MEEEELTRCIDCRALFVIDEKEQQFIQERGWTLPRRCRACRRERREQRERDDRHA
jgi:hypothetical protein